MKLAVPQTREAIAAVPVQRLLAAQAELKAELLAHPGPEHWGRDVAAPVLGARMCQQFRLQLCLRRQEPLDRDRRNGLARLRNRQLHSEGPPDPLRVGGGIT